jgi:hypothetical protein
LLCGLPDPHEVRAALATLAATAAGGGTGDGTGYGEGELDSQDAVALRPHAALLDLLCQGRAGSGPA